MRVFLEEFECLHFTESHFTSLVANGDVLMISVKNLPVSGSHPLISPEVSPEVVDDPRLGWIVNGTIVFRGVSMSKRIIYEYIGNPKNPKGFKKEEVIYDIANAHEMKSKKNMNLKGVWTTHWHGLMIGLYWRILLNCKYYEQ
jgi:hypothetical protein